MEKADNLVQLFGIQFKVYDLLIFVVLVAFVVIGLASATHWRLYRKEEKQELSRAETRLLRLPGVWLSSSMWLNYFNNLLLALSVCCSIIVVVMQAFGSSDDTVRVVLYTLTALASSLLFNFSNGKEKSMGYRDAFDYFNPICEQYEYRYLYAKHVCKDNQQRERDYTALVMARNVAEGIIRDAHQYSQAHRREPASLA